MAAVVNGTAALRLLVDGAKELPLGSTHLGTGGGATGRGVEQKPDDEGVALRNEEPAQLVQPEGAVDPGRGGRELDCGRAVYRGAVAVRVVVMEGCEVLLELECRVELHIHDDLLV